MSSQFIPFNFPPFVGNEISYVQKAISSHKISGDGEFTQRCSRWLENRFGACKALLTTSGSTALDMAAALTGVGPGDEVIVPSYTFSTTAAAFSNLGATLVFVDIRPDTMNIDERKIEHAITSRTKVIVPVHYAGVACEMDAIMAIARRYGLTVVEDAAQAVMSTYNGRSLGTIGKLGCFSFHETKNYSMGEGGALLVNDPEMVERAEIIREKGTNRSRFFRGQVDKYTWVDRGGSYLPSEINAAYLWAQLEHADEINQDRLATWQAYDEAFKPLAKEGLIDIPHVPDGYMHNGHMYWIKLRNLEDRTAFIAYMKEREIGCPFHYVPLHSSPAGMQFGRFDGDDEFTTRESERLVRLPLWYGMGDEKRRRVVRGCFGFFE